MEKGWEDVLKENNKDEIVGGGFLLVAGGFAFGVGGVTVRDILTPIGEH